MGQQLGARSSAPRAAPIPVSTARTGGAQVVLSQYQAGKAQGPSDALAPQTPQPRTGSYPRSGKFVSPANPSFPKPPLSKGVPLLSPTMPVGKQRCGNRRELKVSRECGRGADNSELLRDTTGNVNCLDCHLLFF